MIGGMNKALTRFRDFDLLGEMVCLLPVYNEKCLWHSYESAGKVLK